MRFALFVVAFGCLSPQANASDWLSIPAIAEHSTNAVSPVLYSARDTVAEFNARLAARDNMQTLLVQVSVPTDQISARSLVDRKVMFVWQGTEFSGRVASAFILPAASSQAVDSSVLRVLAHIENRKSEGHWLLPDNAHGQLSIQKTP
jgi:hypothetical protein